MNDTGVFWWQHDGGPGQATFPGTTLGAATTTHTDSLLYGAKAVVIYRILVTAGVAFDTFAINTVTTGGIPTALTGLSALDCGTAGLEYNFPGGLRIESSHANISILTGDASVLTIFYRKLS